MTTAPYTPPRLDLRECLVCGWMGSGTALAPNFRGDPACPECASTQVYRASYPRRVPRPPPAAKV